MIIHAEQKFFLGTLALFPRQLLSFLHGSSVVPVPGKLPHKPLVSEQYNAVLCYKYMPAEESKCSNGTIIREASVVVGLQKARVIVSGGGSVIEVSTRLYCRPFPT
ncbi:hypothetical protein BGW80DRAFT_309424 [Lactifluus volemus]|nr:hypothetical protein BGW80DRAFT_309424 [Lactifluus volemus]